MVMNVDRRPDDNQGLARYHRSHHHRRHGGTSKLRSRERCQVVARLRSGCWPATAPRKALCSTTPPWRRRARIGRWLWLRCWRGSGGDLWRRRCKKHAERIAHGLKGEFRCRIHTREGYRHNSIDGALVDDAVGGLDALVNNDWSRLICPRTEVTRESPVVWACWVFPRTVGAGRLQSPPVWLWGPERR